MAKERSAVWLAPRPRAPVKRVVKLVARELVVGAASPLPTLKCRRDVMGEPRRLTNGPRHALPEVAPSLWPHNVAPRGLEAMPCYAIRHEP